jgi:transcriptional regulator with XRE-family HTH domain
MCHLSGNYQRAIPAALMFSRADVVRRLREKRQWNQRALAHRAGVSMSSVQRIEDEADGATVTAEIAAKIAAAFDLTLHQLDDLARQASSIGVRSSVGERMPADRIAENDMTTHVPEKKTVKVESAPADLSGAHNSAPHAQAGGSPVDDLRDRLLHLYGGMPADMRADFVDRVYHLTLDMGDERRRDKSHPKRRRPAS